MPVLVDAVVPLPDPLRSEGLAMDGERALAEAGDGKAELSVLLAGDEVVTQLNREWRGKDSTTDVLSFPQDADGLLGDVVINVELAARQAEERGHGVVAEVRVLLVHGLAHLLGHDHHTEVEASRMRAAERRLLVAVFGGEAPPGLVDTAWGDGS